MMTHIRPRLFLGCFEDVLHSMAPITHIYTLCESRPVSAHIVFHRPIPDEIYLAPSVWATLVDELEGLMLVGHTVLVHCRLGVSRSPALVVAYLAQTEGMTVAAARLMVKTKRPVVQIHPETWRGIVAWDHQRPS